MAAYSVPYGNSSLQFDLPDDLSVEVVAPVEVPLAKDLQVEVANALENPLGDFSWRNLSGVKSAVVAINDKTRPVPHKDLLPPLLNKLEYLGLAPKDTTFIIATGAHPPMGRQEYPMVVPAEVLQRYPVICHDCDDRANLVELGVSDRGTPVWINRTYMNADLGVAVGNIEPHQFQGFSGGVKSAAIGLAGRTTIDHNHSMMMDPNARLGAFGSNPARQDVEEIGRMIGVDLAVNAVLNGNKEIVRGLAGGPAAVMAAGMPFAREICQVPVDDYFDLMIVSPGGHPKDINVYQAQKALAHASLVTRSGGTIILAAACPLGTGSKKYEHWVQHVNSNQELITLFHQEDFRVGPHKAFQIARDASRVNLYLVSEMEDHFVRSLLLMPQTSIEGALNIVLSELNAIARIGIMPWANATIPLI